MNICETNNTEYKYVYELQFTTYNYKSVYRLPFNCNYVYKLQWHMHDSPI